MNTKEESQVTTAIPNDPLTLEGMSGGQFVNLFICAENLGDGNELLKPEFSRRFGEQKLNVYENAVNLVDKILDVLSGRDPYEETRSNIPAHKQGMIMRIRCYLIDSLCRYITGESF